MALKIVRSGSVVEVLSYSGLHVGSGGARRVAGVEGEYKDENYAQTNITRRASIRRLISSNFQKRDKFFTLTFAENMTDVELANKEFNKFIKRLRYRFPAVDLRYVAVIEFQDRGAVHYHVVCNLPYVKASVLAQIWGKGFVRINSIDDCDNVGAYVTKYMVKDCGDTRLMGRKAYLCSQNLKRPVVMCDWRVGRHGLESRHKVLQLSKLENFRKLEQCLGEVSPVYSTSYISECAGVVDYREYNLDRQRDLIPAEVLKILERMECSLSGVAGAPSESGGHDRTRTRLDIGSSSGLDSVYEAFMEVFGEDVRDVAEV